MRRITALILALLLVGCARQQTPAATAPETTWVPATTCVPETTLPAETETEPTQRPILRPLEEEDQALLLQIGMAELGETQCVECIALVMCTVLNRVEADRFGSTVRSVLYAQDQFTPVMDGSFDNAVPYDACLQALEGVMTGWDEWQGALYYEFCQGESWHSQNLHLLTSHCNTRFYQ